MDIRERLNAASDCGFEIIGRVSLGEMHRRLYGRQHVSRPVLGLTSEKRNLFIGALALSDAVLGKPPKVVRRCQFELGKLLLVRLFVGRCVPFPSTAVPSREILPANLNQSLSLGAVSVADAMHLGE